MNGLIPIVMVITLSTEIPTDTYTTDEYSYFSDIKKKKKKKKKLSEKGKKKKKGFFSKAFGSK